MTKSIEALRAIGAIKLSLQLQISACDNRIEHAVRTNNDRVFEQEMRYRSGLVEGARACGVSTAGMKVRGWTNDEIQQVLSETQFDNWSHDDCNTTY